MAEEQQPTQPEQQPPGSSGGMPPFIQNNLMWIAVGGGAGLVVLVIIIVVVVLLAGGGGDDLKADYIDECTDDRRGWGLDEDVCECGWAIVEHDFNKKAITEIEDARNGDEMVFDIYQDAVGYCNATQELPRRMIPDIGSSRGFGGLSSDIEDYYIEECDDAGVDEETCQCSLDILGGDFDTDTFEELEQDGEISFLFGHALDYCESTDNLPRSLRPDR